MCLFYLLLLPSLAISCPFFTFSQSSRLCLAFVLSFRAKLSLNLLNLTNFKKKITTLTMRPHKQTCMHQPEHHSKFSSSQTRLAENWVLCLRVRSSFLLNSAINPSIPILRTFYIAAKSIMAKPIKTDKLNGFYRLDGSTTRPR